jgi:hypothetical protein
MVPELRVRVPLEDGSIATIQHLPVTTLTKTLGQMTCPTGSSKGAIMQMQEEAQGWVKKNSSKQAQQIQPPISYQQAVLAWGLLWHQQHLCTIC